MAQILKTNQALTFGKIGSIKEYEPFGFDLSETGQSWTTASTVGFSFATDGLVADPNLKLRIAASPFLHEGLIAEQQFYAYINGLFVGFEKLTTHQTMEFFIPRGAISARGCRATFVIPTAASPKALGISADIRKLGLAISSIALVNGK